MPQRLSKVLASSGIASRRHCETLIFSGKVTVNGRVVLLPQTLVSWEADQIAVEGRPVCAEAKKVYYILNKPFGYTCSAVRIGSKRLIVDIFRDFPYRLFSIGRLDRDTTGLLLVTNDGAFANRVIHPSSNITKEYLVKVRQEVSHQHLTAIAQGVRIDGMLVRPVRVTKIRRGTLKIAVKEGKRREVRLMVAKASLDLELLKRVRIGGLLLGDLPEGAWREMTEKDKAVIFSDSRPSDKGIRSVPFIGASSAVARATKTGPAPC